MDNQLQSVRGVSPEEVHRFETLFKLFDEDGSGCITIVELGDLMPRLGLFLDSNELEVLFNAVDSDGSGYIDFQEFLALMVRQREANQLALLESGERETFSMLEEGSEIQFGKLLPDDGIVVVWEFVLLFATLFFFIVVLLEDVSVTATPYLHRVPAALVLFIDAIMRGFVIVHVSGANDDVVVSTFPETLYEYVRNPYHFVPDLLSALPLDFLVHAWSTDAALVLSHLRFLKLVRVPSFFPVLSHELMTPTYAQVHFRVVPFVNMLFWSVIIVHIMSCAWIATGGGDIGYIDASYFVLYTLCTVGYGDIAVESAGQKMFAIFLFLSSTLVTGLVVGKLVQWTQQADLKASTYRQMLETLAVLHHLSVPQEFKQEILALQYHRMLTSFSMYESTCAGMPLAMRDRMMLYARISIVRHVPIFARQPDICLAKLAMALVNVMVLPDEYIIIAGEEGSEMFFLFHGMCDVFLPNGTRVAVIKRGGIFGEIALLQSCRRAASIRSLTYCQLFRLDKAAFDDITLAFPSLREDIEEEMNRRAVLSALAQAKMKNESVVSPGSPGSNLTEAFLDALGKCDTKPGEDVEKYGSLRKKESGAGAGGSERKSELRLSGVPSLRAESYQTESVSDTAPELDPVEPMATGEAGEGEKEAEAEATTKEEEKTSPPSPSLPPKPPNPPPVGHLAPSTNSPNRGLPRGPSELFGHNVQITNTQRKPEDESETGLGVKRHSTLSQLGLRVLVHCSPKAKQKGDDADVVPGWFSPAKPNATDSPRPSVKVSSKDMKRQASHFSEGIARSRRKRESVVNSLHKWGARRASHLPGQNPRGRMRHGKSAMRAPRDSLPSPTNSVEEMILRQASSNLPPASSEVIQKLSGVVERLEARMCNIEHLCESINRKVGDSKCTPEPLPEAMVTVSPLLS
eukprot:Hpha_TRINITY_DN15431_c1_g15::TRINITY_DN15431_c1_g15_i1::g.174193::m.174193